MNRVIKKDVAKAGITYADSVSEDLYYGFLDSCTRKGWISYSENLESWETILANEMNMPSAGMSEECNNIFRFVDYCLDINYQIFEFETYQELLKWLAEDTRRLNND